MNEDVYLENALIVEAEAKKKARRRRRGPYRKAASLKYKT